jgi:hypothetical protein
MTKNTVFVVMGEGDNNGTLPEHTMRVFASRDQAHEYAQELYDEFFSRIVILERNVRDRRVADRRKTERNVTFYGTP